jgi:hypothetical protein|tara:strand:+ start:267 stop:386 length:120 start_codon:yes stop_codon:yes gene_type:complete
MRRVKKVISALEKASKTHKKQSVMLKKHLAKLKKKRNVR